MSNEYTVNLYFDTPRTNEQKKEIEKRLDTAYFKDAIDEEHDSLWYYEEPEGDNLFPQQKKPTFEEALAIYLSEDGNRRVSVEWSVDSTEAEASFSGWECCRDAVKSEVRKIVKESRN